MVLKKVDNRIRVLIENGVQKKQRSLFVVVGDKGKDQVSCTISTKEHFIYILGAMFPLQSARSCLQKPGWIMRFSARSLFSVYFDFAFIYIVMIHTHPTSCFLCRGRVA